MFVFFDFGILLKSLEFIKIKKSESKELKGKNYNVNCYKKFQWTQLEATTKTKQQNYVLFFKVQKFNSIINNKIKKKSKTLWLFVIRTSIVLLSMFMLYVMQINWGGRMGGIVCQIIPWNVVLYLLLSLNCFAELYWMMLFGGIKMRVWRTRVIIVYNYNIFIYFKVIVNCIN